MSELLHLSASARFYPDHLVLSQCGHEFAFQCDAALTPTLQKLFLKLDGRHSLADLEAMFPQGSWAAIADILQSLNHQGLLDDVTPVIPASVAQNLAEPHDRAEPHGAGQDSASQDSISVSVLVQQIQQRLDATLQKNDLWQELTPQVLYGLALELHYYLDQASAFQAPLQDFQPSVRLRQATEALAQATGELRSRLARALESSGVGADGMGADRMGADGISAEAIAQHLPLPETVALLNGLAFWSQGEPQFALLLQARLSRSLVRLMEMYQSACESTFQSIHTVTNVEMGFAQGIGQVAAAALGLEGAIARLSSACMDEMVLTPDLQQRYIGQSHLFAELYDHWLAAIPKVYSDATQLQRNVADLTGNRISAERPRLKEGVLLEFREAGLAVQGHGSGIAIDLAPDEQPEMEQLLRCLQAGGFSQAELAKTAPSLAEQVGKLLQVFQGQGWLTTETVHRPLSGQQFYCELERFLNSLKQQLPPSPMLQQMLDGSITREQLIGYSLESYHVTHLCPRLLAPALGQWESRTTQSLLHDFFTSELHHDQLVENSLKAVGFNLEQIRTMQPLPMTFAVCSSLGVFARRHPLSFKSALMLFEEDDKIFHQLFEQRCQDLDLPPGFYRPILLHAHINEDGEHDQITKMLLQEVPYISVEEQQLVKQNLAVLLMSMVLRTHEILDYYGNLSHAMPRCF